MVWDGRQNVRTDGGQPDNSPQDAESELSQSTFRYALAYPRRQGWTPILKGGVLLFLYFLLLPLFVVLGYWVRVAAAAAENEEDPPPLTDWGGLLKDGVVAVAVFLPFFVVVWLLGFVAIRVNPLLYIVVSLIVGFVFPALGVNYSVHRTFKSAYDVEILTDFAFTELYVKNFFVSIGLGIALTILLIFSVITIVGPVFVSFFTYTAFAAFWGRVYHLNTSQQDHQPA